MGFRRSAGVAPQNVGISDLASRRIDPYDCTGLAISLRSTNSDIVWSLIILIALAFLAALLVSGVFAILTRYRLAVMDGAGRAEFETVSRFSTIFLVRITFVIALATVAVTSLWQAAVPDLRIVSLIVRGEIVGGWAGAIGCACINVTLPQGKLAWRRVASKTVAMVVLGSLIVWTVVWGLLTTISSGEWAPSVVGVFRLTGELTAGFMAISLLMRWQGYRLVHRFEIHQRAVVEEYAAKRRQNRLKTLKFVGFGWGSRRH